VEREERDYVRETTLQTPRSVRGSRCSHEEEPTLEQVCWQDLWLRGELMLEQSVPEGLHNVEGTHAGEVHGGLCPVGGTPCWSRGRV